MGPIRDITERKRAEEALRESERTFRELLEGVQFVAVVTAQNGKIIFCNDYALSITGWSKEEVIGRAAKELLDPESLLQGVDQKAIAAPAGRTRPFIEGSILEKNGKIVGGLTGAARRCVTRPAAWPVSPVWERMSPSSEPFGPKRHGSKAKNDS